MPINETIKKLRADKELTQQAFADRLRYNRQKIADWERGKSSPSADDLILLSRTFDVSADYLLGLTDAATSDKDVQFVCDYTGLNETTISKLRNQKEISKVLLCFINYLGLNNSTVYFFLQDLRDLLEKEKEYRSFIISVLDSEKVRELILLDRAFNLEEGCFLSSLFDDDLEHNNDIDLAEFRLQKQFSEFYKDFIHRRLNGDFYNEKEEFYQIMKKLYELSGFGSISEEGELNGEDQEEE